MFRERSYCLDRLTLCEVCISLPVAAIAGSVIGGGLSAYGSMSAASTEAGAANNAAANQMKMYQQTRSDLAPYMMGGQTAFSNLQNLMGAGGPTASANMLNGLRNYPGYQFALQQGQQGLDRTAAAKGLLLSGGQLKDTVNYNQGMADQLFGNYFNQNMDLAKIGQNSAAGVGTQGQNAASTAGNMQMLGAGALGNGINNVASTFGNTINNSLQAYSMLQGSNDNIPGTIPITPSQLTGQYYPMAA